MRARLILSFGLSALMLGGSVVGCAGGGDRIAAASDRSAKVQAKTAARDAAAAGKALARRDATQAIELAESAVALAPRDAGYRLLLGQAYQQAGRFASARDTFAEVVQLAPGNGKAALNLALAQIATGDWAAAQATLAQYQAVIPIGDLGLATALAGNPAAAIATLNAAARAPGADAKVRQNLALSYALAGQWNMARVAAAADMSAADVDARLEQWAAFAQPKSASDQVASLLGVTPAPDAGRPVALALNAPAPMMPAAEAPVQLAEAAPTVAPAPDASRAAFAKIVFAPAREVVQPLPTMMARVDSRTVRRATVTPIAARGEGDWYVQIGAYSSAAAAHAGWDRAERRFSALTGHRPTGTTVAAAQGSLYRLSIGGFDRDQADRMCDRFRAEGGTCFVRREAGDRIAQWLRTPVQMASR